MADTLFMITGGGTGAKVAEALTHLCAAGIAPREVHLLLVDADSTNGNLERAVSTAAVYSEMQKWPWSVETTTGSKWNPLASKDSHKLTLFASDLHVHRLTEPLDAAESGGIRSQAGSDEMRMVLDLLYDRDEQEAKANMGFKARPNLGCLLLADHLNKKLPAVAKGFLSALTRAASGGKEVPIVVAASIFGGTGASLLPVARGAIEMALQVHEGLPAGGSEPSPTARSLRWGGVMVLPHYQPTKRLESVDPERYLLDTSNALQYYGMAQTTSGDLFDTIYAIGSDNPARNLVRPVLGLKDQANPAYVEELVAALGAIHFAETQGRGSNQVRVFKPEAGLDKLKWAELPLGGQERLSDRFAYLLHLAAFYLRPADPHQRGLTKGLSGILYGSPDEDLEAEGWFKHVLEPWAVSVSPTYAATPKGERATALKSKIGPQSADALQGAAVQYFARLLLWASSALRDGDGGVLHLIDFKADENYSLLRHEMGKMRADDVNAPAPGEQSFDPESDNALARLLRIVLAAEVTAHERTRRKGIVAGNFSLTEPDDGRIGLRITREQVREALRNASLSDVADDYTRTDPEFVTA